MEENMLSSARKRFSNIGFRFFIGVILVYIIQNIAIKLLEVIGKSVPTFISDYNNIFFCIMFAMYLIGEPLMLFIVSRVPVEGKAVEKKKMPVGHLIIAILMCYGGMMLGNVVGTGITSVIGIFKQAPVDNPLVSVVGMINPFVNFLFIVIVAPIMEELLFRKVLIDRIAKYGEAVAVTVSSIMFALYHENLNQAVYTVFMGALLAFVYVKTRNVKYPIIIHMVTNFFGSFIGPVIMELTGYEEISNLVMSGDANWIESLTSEQWIGYGVFMVYALLVYAMIIGGVVLLIVKRKKFTFKAGEICLEKGKRFKTIFLNIGMALYCVYYIVLIVRQLMA